MLRPGLILLPTAGRAAAGNGGGRREDGVTVLGGVPQMVGTGRPFGRGQGKPEPLVIVGTDVTPPAADGGAGELDGGAEVRGPDRPHLAWRRRRAGRWRAGAGNQLAQGVGLKPRADAGGGPVD